MKAIARAVFDFFRYTVGHRGGFLLFLFLLDVLFGWAMIDNQTNDQPITLMTWHEWGVAWIAVGLFLLTGAFQKADRAQYTVAITFKGIWVAALITNELHNHVKGGGIDAIIWGMVVAVVFLISSWPEPPPKRRDGG